jgi:hypothetical protein
MYAFSPLGLNDTEIGFDLSGREMVGMPFEAA